MAEDQNRAETARGSAPAAEPPAASAQAPAPRAAKGAAKRVRHEGLGRPHRGRRGPRGGQAVPGAGQKDGTQRSTVGLCGLPRPQRAGRRVHDVACGRGPRLGRGGRGLLHVLLRLRRARLRPLHHRRPGQPRGHPRPHERRGLGRLLHAPHAQQRGRPAGADLPPHARRPLRGRGERPQLHAHRALRGGRGASLPPSCSCSAAPTSTRPSATSPSSASFSLASRWCRWAPCSSCACSPVRWWPLATGRCALPTAAAGSRTRSTRSTTRS